MPKSKKPRKRYRKEEHAQPPVVTQEKIDQIHSMTTDYEPVTEGALPQGCATLDHLCCMRDVINLAITDLLLQNEYTIEQSVILNAGGDALQSVTDNGLLTSAANGSSVVRQSWTPWNSPPDACIRRLRNGRCLCCSDSER